MLQFNATTVTIFKPNRNISDEGEIRTATYSIIFSNLPCEVIELSGQEKLMMGINASQPVRRLFIEPVVFVSQNIPVPALILPGMTVGGYGILQGLSRSFQIAIIESNPLDEYYIVETNQDHTRWLVQGPVNHWISPHEFIEAKLFLLRAPPKEIV